MLTSYFNDIFGSFVIICEWPISDGIMKLHLLLSTTIIYLLSIEITDCDRLPQGDSGNGGLMRLAPVTWRQSDPV